MALILNIDTATESASVCISKQDECLALLENNNQKEHASFVHVAIEQLVQQTGVSLTQVDAIAVTAGPGSYTGLRVGLATAKGLCYALNKPLISINTLTAMTVAARQQVNKDRSVLYCPMIDARRMEVFTALYDENLQAVMNPKSLIVDETSFDAYMTNNKVVFFGSGSAKVQSVITNTNALFATVQHSAKHVAALAWQAFQQNNFVGIAYAEPVYLKEFYSTSTK